MPTVVAISLTALYKTLIPMHEKIRHQNKSKEETERGINSFSSPCFILLLISEVGRLLKMVNSDAIRNAVGILGNVISFGLFLSPLPTFLTIIKNKDVEKFSPVPYLTTLLNCLLWCFYGLPIVRPNSLLVITINGAGLVFETVYLTIFLLYSNPKLRAKIALIILAELVFMAAVAAVVLKELHTLEKRQAVVGILCIVFNIGMYASPLSVMKLVIQTKSVKYMPFTLSLVSFFNGICWTTYALIKFDLYITIPNLTGTFLVLVQLMIYAIYYKSTPKGEKTEKEVEMA